jgi:hypothetical protein
MDVSIFLSKLGNNSFTWDIILGIVFLIFIAIFLIKNKKNVKLEKMVFPLLYAILYRGKFGIAWMEKFVKKHKESVKLFGLISIGVGFFLMLFFLFFSLTPTTIIAFSTDPLGTRILKVIYSDNWKNGEPQDNKGSKKQIIKYQSLEQYEDSLNNVYFKEPPTLAKKSKNYKIKYMLEFEAKDNNVFLNLDALDNPFAYALRIEDKNEFKETNVDLIETFNYIAGIQVKSIKQLKDKKTTYVVVKGLRNEKDIVVIWRDKTEGFDPKADKKFITENILKEEYDEILVNGNSLINNAKSIDEVFKANMFRG